jgi:hypothetical protein
MPGGLKALIICIRSIFLLFEPTGFPACKNVMWQ